MYVRFEELQKIVRSLSERIQEVSVREPAPVASSTVANLPGSSAATVGRLRFATNGRKVGEGAGAGTGTLVYNDGTAWRRVGDDTTVVA